MSRYFKCFKKEVNLTIKQCVQKLTLNFAQNFLAKNEAFPIIPPPPPPSGQIPGSFPL